MLNKSTTNNGIKNSAFTPIQVKTGLKHIPYNYILKVQAVLDAKIKQGLIEKNFTKTYISEERAGKKFNPEIMEALIEHPILIERPIIIEGNKAIIGRPTTKIIEFL